MIAAPSPTSPGHAAPGEPMPAGIQNVYYFDVFNTASWSVVLGAPMMLFLQHLNATATLIAIAAGMSPILNTLQIPAARFVEKIGYKRFVLAGWTTRSFLVVGMTLIAFLPDSFHSLWRIYAMLSLSFIYNAMRGISACGMLPWFTHIVPESRRGEFLAKDQSANAISSIISVLLFGKVLSEDHAWYSFGLLFTLSFLAAMGSLYFLRRVPDVPVEKITSSVTAVPWREIFFYKPFYNYARLCIVVNTAFGASGAFWVRFFKTSPYLHLSNANVLYIASGTSCMSMLALLMATPVIDRVHNKLVLSTGAVMLCFHFIGWGFVAAGVIPFNWTILIIQAITSGFGGALWNLANLRMIMGIVPAMGRPHFLALYSVAVSLTVGVIPLFWGPILDHMANWQVAWGIWKWNSYSVLYTALTFTMIVGLGMLQSIEEPKKMTWDVFISELLVKTPSRAVSRIIGRLRGPTSLG